MFIYARDGDIKMKKYIKSYEEYDDGVDAEII
jgi:hypothetical protein